MRTPECLLVKCPVCGNDSYPIHGFCKEDFLPRDIPRNVNAGVYSYRCYGNKHRFLARGEEIPHVRSHRENAWADFFENRAMDSLSIRIGGRSVSLGMRAWEASQMTSNPPSRSKPVGKTPVMRRMKESAVLTICYPSGRVFTVTGMMSLVRNQPAIRTRQGKLITLDPLALVTRKESVLYNPRANANLATPTQKWLNEHPEWPPSVA